MASKEELLQQTQKDLIAQAKDAGIPYAGKNKDDLATALADDSEGTKAEEETPELKEQTNLPEVEVEEAPETPEASEPEVVESEVAPAAPVPAPDPDLEQAPTQELVEVQVKEAAAPPVRGLRQQKLYEQKAVLYTDGLSGVWADQNHERAYEYDERLQSNDPRQREAGDGSLSEAAWEEKSDQEKAIAGWIRNRTEDHDGRTIRTDEG